MFVYCIEMASPTENSTKKKRKEIFWGKIPRDKEKNCLKNNKNSTVREKLEKHQTIKKMSQK